MKRYAITNGARYLMHSGRMGMHWGVRNGPPYPLDAAKMSDSGREQYGLKKLKKDYKVDPKNGLRLKSKEQTRAQDCAAANPYLKREFKSYSWMNCAPCVAAYDIRRRGYDVVAGDPFKDGVHDDGILNFYNSVTEDDVQYYYEYIDDVPTRVTVKHSKELYDHTKKTILDQGNGARGMLLVDLPTCSHAISYENRNGEILVLDPQENREYTLKWVSDISVDIGVFRTDDKEPNYDWLQKEGVIRNA